MTLTADVRAKIQSDTSSLAVIATVTALMSWFASVAPDPTTQLVSALLSGVAAFLAAAVGLALFGN